MTEEAAPAAPAAPGAAPAPAAKKPGASTIVLAAVVAGALVAGLAAGMFVVGPRFAARPSDAHTAAAEPSHGAPKASKPKKDGHGKAKEEHGRPVHRLDNIIVNPAGSHGTRFLLATVAFEVADDRIRDDLRAREVELRDVVISTFERHTLEELTRPGARDSVRGELTTAVLPLVGDDAGLRVFLPQFVIQ